MNKISSPLSVGELGCGVGCADQAGQWYHDPDPLLPKMPNRPGCSTWPRGGVGVDRFPDRFSPSVEGLQLGAEQLSGVGVNVFDFQPLGVDGFARFAVLTVGLLRITVGVEGQSVEQQIGEQVGAALLFGARILGAEAAGHRRQHAVDGRGIGGGDFAGDITDAVGPLHDCDAAFGQGAAMPLLEGQPLELHDEPQQPPPGAVFGDLVCAASTA